MFCVQGMEVSREDKGRCAAIDQVKQPHIRRLQIGWRPACVRTLGHGIAEMLKPSLLSPDCECTLRFLSAARARWSVSALAFIFRQREWWMWQQCRPYRDGLLP